MFNKNDEREGIVLAVGADGEGIIKDEGYTIFVPFSLEGEKIKYKVLKVKGNVAYGKVIDVLTPAEERVRPKCPIFGKCGGCRLQHVKYLNQLRIKEKNVQTCFKKIAGIDVCVSPAFSGSNEFRYRNKLQLPVREQNGQTVIGFYAENSHRVVPTLDCLINAEWTRDIISAFNEYIRKNNLKGYDEEKNTGDIREITVKDVKGKLIITVVCLKAQLKNLQSLVSILRENIKMVFSLYLNVNDKTTNVIYGEQFSLICGDKDYDSSMLGIKYKAGVRSFMQVNDSVCSKLYSAVISEIDADENTTVIDAYSGAGLMTALLAKKAKKAIGIEIVREAVEIADQLKKDNGLSDKIQNYLGKCEELLPRIIEREKSLGQKIGVVLDPPRKGCDLKVINAVRNSGADKIVYVSCKPSTLARDVGLIVGSLKEVGGEIKRAEEYTPKYNISLVKPFDMFAQTKHVEVLCVLTKN